MKLARAIYRSTLLSSTFSKTFLHSFAPYQTLQIAIVNHCRLHLPLLALVYGLLVNQHWPILVLVLRLFLSLFLSSLSFSFSRLIFHSYSYCIQWQLSFGRWPSSRSTGPPNRFPMEIDRPKAPRRSATDAALAFLFLCPNAVCSSDI